MSIEEAAYASESWAKQPPVSSSLPLGSQPSQANAIGEHRNTLSRARAIEERMVSTRVAAVATIYLPENDERRHTRRIATLSRHEQASSNMSAMKTS